MDYLPEDYDRLYGPENTTNKTEGWSMVGWLVCLVIVGLLVGGCDSQAAENTAIAEAEAHQRHVDLVKAVMDCDATVNQSVFTGIPIKQGCYVRGVKAKEKK